MSTDRDEFVGQRGHKKQRTVQQFPSSAPRSSRDQPSPYANPDAHGVAIFNSNGRRASLSQGSSTQYSASNGAYMASLQGTEPGGYGNTPDLSFVNEQEYDSIPNDIGLRAGVCGYCGARQETGGQCSRKCTDQASALGQAGSTRGTISVMAANTWQGVTGAARSASDKVTKRAAHEYYKATH